MRNRYVLLLDILFFLITPGLAVLIRLEGDFQFDHEFASVLNVVIFLGIIKLAVFGMGGLYQGMWEHASIGELARILGLGVVLCILQSILFYFAKNIYPAGFENIPRTVALIDAILATAFVGLIRFNVRLSASFGKKFVAVNGNTPVLIVGAGDAGVMVVDEILSNPQLEMRPVGFIDDDKRKHRLKVRGLNVYGGREDIPKVAERLGAKQVIVAMPTAGGNTIREIDAICKKAKLKAKTLPGVFELIGGQAKVSKLRDIALEDLLRREPAQIDTESLKNSFQGKRVLVTGAGGSIGGELCRQVASYGPAQLILLGHGENSIFGISNELTQEFPGVMITTVIADIRDRKRLTNIFKLYRPHSVFHAAAHKHVPLMELNPGEAVTNNILGTFNLVEMSMEMDVERFVLISTDKAVKPTSVMGASKRVAELIVQSAAKRSGKPFEAVRFGNVLGSRGSVIPLFREQIAKGRPITITHPDVKRYFMTIPEAVQLVLQASIIGKGGEIFVLDMGKPVKIVDLADDLIRLSGLERGKDIDVVFTGLRPGEKLFEELVFDDEHFVDTAHPSIHALKASASGKSKRNGQMLEYQYVQEAVSILAKHAEKGNAKEIRIALKELVEEAQFQIPDEPL